MQAQKLHYQTYRVGIDSYNYGIDFLNNCREDEVGDLLADGLLKRFENLSHLRRDLLDLVSFKVANFLLH